MSDTFTAVLKTLSRRKILSSPGDGGQQFQRCLSVVDITCLGLSTILGIGVYTILSFAARENTGPSVVLSFLISSVASCLAGLCYSELASRFPKGGSAYCYVYATIGEMPAFLIGWSLIFEYQFCAALAAKSWIQYINSVSNATIITSIKLKSPHFLNGDESDAGYFDFPSAIVILTVGLLLMRNLKTSCFFNNILIFMCVLVIGGIVLISIFEIDAENWVAGQGFFPFGVTGIFTGASICFFAFNGYDIIGSLSAESDDRIRTIPAAISLTFLLGLVACFAISIAITLLVPFSLLDRNAPLVEAFVTRHLDGMNYFVILGATCGLISSLFASLLVLSRLLFSLANDGLLFSFLTKYDTSTGTTKTATIVSCLLCSLISICFETTTILKLIGTGTILSYMCASLAVLSLRYGSIQRLPFEACELMSRDDTFTDYGSHRVMHSTSDCYLDKQHNHNDMLSPQVVHSRHNCLNDTFCHTYTIQQANERLSPLRNYGSCVQCNARTMSVEFINQTFITSLSNSSLNAKQEPTEQSSAFVTKITATMMTVMLLMGVCTIHAPRLDGHEWWMELMASALLVVICVCIVQILRQPRHSSATRNAIPCMPLLPILAIWLNIHLIVCLPYTSWLAALIWALLGVFVFMSYGLWNSKEGSQSAVDCDQINQFGLTDTTDDGQQIIGCDEEIHGSSL